MYIYTFSCKRVQTHCALLLISTSDILLLYCFCCAFVGIVHHSQQSARTQIKNIYIECIKNAHIRVCFYVHKDRMSVRKWNIQNCCRHSALLGTNTKTKCSSQYFSDLLAQLSCTTCVCKYVFVFTHFHEFVFYIYKSCNVILNSQKHVAK